MKNAVDVESFTYWYPDPEHDAASTTKEREASARLVRRPWAGPVIAPLCRLTSRKVTPAIGVPRGYVGSGRPSNGMDNAIVVRVATPAFSRSRRMRSSRSPVVLVRTFRM